MTSPHWMFTVLGIACTVAACSGRAASTVAPAVECTGGSTGSNIGPGETAGLAGANGGSPSGGQAGPTLSPSGSAGAAGAAGAAADGNTAGEGGNGSDGTTIPAVYATGKVTIAANLDASAKIPDFAFAAGDPANTSNFSTTIGIYCATGDAFTINVYFAKIADNRWDYYALAAGEDLIPYTQGDRLIGSGTLVFTSNGALQARIVEQDCVITLQGDSLSQSIRFDFGTPIAEGGTGLDGLTQFGSPSNVSSQSQDGFGNGLGRAGALCNHPSDCLSKDCYEHTCFCGPGCACRHSSDCSNVRDVCVNGACVLGD